MVARQHNQGVNLRMKNCCATDDVSGIIVSDAYSGQIEIVGVLVKNDESPSFEVYSTDERGAICTRKSFDDLERAHDYAIELQKGTLSYHQGMRASSETHET